MISKVYLFPIFILAFFLNSAVAQKRLNGENLLKEDAAFRSEIVSEPQYKLFFDLRSAQEFKVQSEIYFKLSKVPNFLTVDLSESQISLIELNGKVLEKSAHNGSLILLKGEDLKKGDNSLKVNYSHAYSKNGSGLYRFEDPEDKKIYLFTDLEPYDAHTVFPCFDQPDLKGTYQVSVQVPPSWTVITSNQETQISNHYNSRIWLFPTSQKFSTYVFSLMAGDYKIWKDRYNNIPLRLLARQSLARYVNPQFWFQITKEGLAYYENFFQVSFPFTKYDQIIVPDFNSGAMENVAAVTFTEKYIKRGNENRNDQFIIANTLLHEMSHMWFGNLVTMKWWGDLWLNETFATYMSFKASEEATDFKEAWKAFASDDKAGALFEDQMPTTHPVRADVEDTDNALSNFDGITYAKGASIIKQLAFVMGQENFKKGLKSYFTTFAFQNASFSDFMKSLSEASGIKLSNFSKDWLENAGVNTLRSSFQCEKGKVTSIQIKQTADDPQNPSLREHQSLVAFVKMKDSQAELMHVEKVKFSKAENTISMTQEIDCPDFVFPNFGDHDYVRLYFDQDSLKFIETHLKNLRGSSDFDLMRNSLWQALWDATQNAQLSLDRYLSVLVTHLPEEHEATTLRNALVNLETIMHWAPQKKKAFFANKIEDFLSTQFQNRKNTKDQQSLYFDAYVSQYLNTKQSKVLRQKLNSSKITSTLAWDPDHQWKALRALCKDSSNCLSLLNSQKQKDRSQNGQNNFYEALASQKNIQNKHKIFSRIVEAKDKHALLTSSMRGFWSWNQESLQKNFQDKYFKSLIELQEKADDHYVSSFAEDMLPFSCNEEDFQKFSQQLNVHRAALKPDPKKILTMAHRNFEKCLQAQKVALSSENLN